MNKHLDLKDKAVSIVGLGRSAVGAARLLLREGAAPFVTDAGEGVAECAAALKAMGVPYETGGHTEKALTEDTALVVASPGVPANIPLLAQARARDIRVLAEMELGWRYCDAPVIAVTGTNGKTTTTCLLQKMISACGFRVALAGNNDTPLSEAVLAVQPWDFVVAEVSSYQLETIENFSPWIGVVLNLTPDHLGRHGDMAGYASAKARLFMNMHGESIAILNADDPYVAKLPVPDMVPVSTFGIQQQVRHGAMHIEAHPPVPLDSLKIPGRHNIENALAALSVIDAAKFDWDAAVSALQAFEGVEHRIEFVAEWNGVKIYNDSKSTNVDSLRVALESFPQQPIVLIAGGRGKGGGYMELKPLAKTSLKFLVTIGEDAGQLEQDLGGVVAYQRADDMQSAVSTALEKTTTGDIVLLSPACASFDWYKNYEERGRDFKTLVLNLVKAQEPRVINIGEPA